MVLSIEKLETSGIAGNLINWQCITELQMIPFSISIFNVRKYQYTAN